MTNSLPKTNTLTLRDVLHTACFGTSAVKHLDAFQLRYLINKTFSLALRYGWISSNEVFLNCAKLRLVDVKAKVVRSFVSLSSLVT